MKTHKTLQAYRHRLKGIVPRSVKALKGYVRNKRAELDETKNVNIKMIKVCFGPCRCFSAAKK
jgi:hypothetical protein